MSTKFSPLKRDYEAERKALECERVPVSFHPLLHSSEEEALNLASVNLGVADSSEQDDANASEEDDDPLSSFDDPLSSTALGGGDFDPLGARGANVQVQQANNTSTDDDDDGDGPNKGNSKLDSIWLKEKAKILKEYNVTGKIRVTASFMTGNGTMEDVGPKTEPMDKTKARLEKLEQKK